MNLVTLPILAAMFGVGLASLAVAAGGGGAAGGSGHQRAINSGLPPGDRGPVGSQNNPRPSPGAEQPSGIQGSPRRESDAQ